MTDDPRLMIFGASARAAAFSALRAGLEPWCADLFADVDLQARCSVARISTDGYPTTFGALVQSDMSGSWMYTGALENVPYFVTRMASLRPLWGNFGLALHRVRSPSFLAKILKQEGLACPVVLEKEPLPSDKRRWLIKPIAGAGGRGIRFWSPTAPRRKAGSFYFQEYIEGESWSAVFIAYNFQARFLGMTQQLIGESWLHAAPFHYCGSLYSGTEPVWIPAVQKVGSAIAKACGLRGLFGVDGVVRDGVFWPVEVNPRYTASMELFDYAGIPVLAHHSKVFDAHAPNPSPATPSPGCLGKAILFAREAVAFPCDGPWMRWVADPPPLQELPGFADIPPPSETIAAGRPVLTFFAHGSTPQECRDRLRVTAEDLDHRLFGR